MSSMGGEDELHKTLISSYLFNKTISYTICFSCIVLGLFNILTIPSTLSACKKTKFAWANEQTWHKL